MQAQKLDQSMHQQSEFSSPPQERRPPVVKVDLGSPSLKNNSTSKGEFSFSPRSDPQSSSFSLNESQSKDEEVVEEMEIMPFFERRFNQGYHHINHSKLQMNDEEEEEDQSPLQHPPSSSLSPSPQHPNLPLSTSSPLFSHEVSFGAGRDEELENGWEEEEEEEDDEEELKKESWDEYLETIGERIRRRDGSSSSSSYPSPDEFMSKIMETGGEEMVVVLEESESDEDENNESELNGGWPGLDIGGGMEDLEEDHLEELNRWRRILG